MKGQTQVTDKLVPVPCILTLSKLDADVHSCIQAARVVSCPVPLGLKLSSVWYASDQVEPLLGDLRKIFTRSKGHHPRRGDQ